MSASSSSSRPAGHYGQQQQYHHHQQQQQPADAFTPEMRDRQARGKDPYQDSEDSSETNAWNGRRRMRDEPFTVIENRRKAAQILDNPELLMADAQKENDATSVIPSTFIYKQVPDHILQSIPAARLRYTRMLCGVEAPAQLSNQRLSPSSKASPSRHHHHHGSKSRGHTPSKRQSSGMAGERSTKQY